jgi:6-phosphofructokinase 1
MAIGLTVPDRAGRVVASDLEIRILGQCRFPSPLLDRLPRDALHYVGKADRVLRYIDPSYHIRSVPASPTDSLYCWNMARNAVHAAMAGNTEMLIGRWHGRFVLVPSPLATRYRKQVDTTSDLWMSVVESTGQPLSWS